MAELTPGSRVGPYEIVMQIGAGGMGEVYRARDTRLDRIVALKVVSEGFALDAERVARFEREARTLASLNHPNIAQVYGFEVADAIRAIVMEFVDGDDLSKRIAAGPMPLDDVIPIAKQIADALETAHSAGIVHRDLKPANIKVRGDGTVKVLDFGLAKAIDQGAGSGNPSAASAMNSPTITTPAMTLRGVILGTAAYMAPEQAKGRAVDKRADMWAFGCVLFEMLTGKRAFDGEDMSEVMAAVIKSEPDWTAIPASVPPHIVSLVRRCLEKDPRKRVGDAAVAQFVLNDAPVSAVADGRNVAPRERWVIATGALALIAVVAVGWAVIKSRTGPAPQPMRFAIVAAESQPLDNSQSERDLIISPDGRRIIHRAGSDDASARLVVRDVDQLDARILVGTEGARSPFFSSDGQWVGFFADRALKKISISGGPPQTLCAYVGTPRGAAWYGDTIVFATAGQSGSLQRVSSSGGAPAAVRTVATSGDSRGAALTGDHWFPSFLPDGRRLLFSLARGQSPPVTAVIDLQTGEERIVLQGGWQAQFVAPATLVFNDGALLRAVAFDVGRAEIKGDPVAVLEGVCCQGGAADVAISETGTVVYVPGAIGSRVPSVLQSSALLGPENVVDLSLVWVDRSGREEPLKGARRPFADPRISPDGRLAVVEAADAADDIWTLDLSRGALTRQTFEPGEDETATWMPDGKMLAYAASRTDNPRAVFRRRADGAGTEEAMWSGTQHVHVETATPDGRALILSALDQENAEPDLVLLPLDGDRTFKPLTHTPFAEAGARLSPDGRWLAYFSDETGRSEVYVRAYPSLESKTQVSTAGGREPVWSKKGDELFYRGEGAVMAVKVTTAAALSVSAPQKLFADRYYVKGTFHTGYDVARDGRFLFVKVPVASQDSATSSRIPQTHFIVVINWFEELKQKLAK